MRKQAIMRWRLLFFISLGVNLALAGIWFASTRSPGTDRDTSAATNAAAATVKTNVVVRRQFFSWNQVESDDYPTYVANLREIGCPEQTIRDIIIADVNGLYARKIATDIVTPDQQWWRSEPDAEVARAAADKLRLLEDDRRALLGRLLGTNWESGDLVNLPRPSRPGIALDGPILGMLSTDAKQAVEDAATRAQQRLQAYLDSQRLLGKNPDPAELAKLRQQTRTELAGILTPPQLEEYLLRYSQNATNLRSDLGQLKYFSASPDEFRAIFRATDPFDQQLELLVGNDPNTVLQRNALLQQRESALKLALGADRYDQYVLLHDPAYRDAVQMAQDAGTPDAAKAIYEVALATALQQATVRANTNLTPAQLAVELKRIELEQLKANALAMGQDVPPDSSTPAPVTAPPPLPPVPTHAYVLGAGESAASVAMIYGVPLSAIQAVNPNVNIRRLQRGDTIQIPFLQSPAR